MIHLDRRTLSAVGILTAIAMLFGGGQAHAGEFWAPPDWIIDGGSLAVWALAMLILVAVARLAIRSIKNSTARAICWSLLAQFLLFPLVRIQGMTRPMSFWLVFGVIGQHALKTSLFIAPCSLRPQC